MPVPLNSLFVVPSHSRLCNPSYDRTLRLHDLMAVIQTLGLAAVVVGAVRFVTACNENRQQESGSLSWGESSGVELTSNQTVLFLITYIVFIFTFSNL